jgi:hypothetical protein
MKRSIPILVLLPLRIGILALANKLLFHLFLVERMQETLLEYFPNLVFNLILVVLTNLLISGTLEVGLWLIESKYLAGH